MEKYVPFSEVSIVLEQLKHAPFLCKLEEADDNELHITIMSATTGGCADVHEVCENTALEQILSHCKPIEANPEQSFEIIFENYILYQVRNESFCSYDADEIRSGKFMIVFEKSKLLDYLMVSTDACQLDDGMFYPGEWKHYGIYTRSHIIDVVALDEPKVFCRVQ
ncbi:hypothetical protein LK537_12655 [Lachnoclostridium pacaense]|uniref:hypothetical protein n=1 Tax=Enterocloster hominis (ex Hitch et al. 2024) TaxID=1917870 RepID=UPI001D0FCD21|nr:hypothetical protein [Lachnoclostridium pacaense]MCC2818147.1 hypothetical protein [Lachnoclostridium pacaense]